MLTYLMLIRLAALCPNAVLQRKLHARTEHVMFLSDRTSIHLVDIKSLLVF